MALRTGMNTPSSSRPKGKPDAPTNNSIYIFTSPGPIEPLIDHKDTLEKPTLRNCYASPGVTRRNPYLLGPNASPPLFSALARCLGTTRSRNTVSSEQLFSDERNQTDMCRISARIQHGYLLFRRYTWMLDSGL